MNAQIPSKWSASDTSAASTVGILEFEDNAGDWHDFTILALSDRLVFGGYCNAGFLESGYIAREDYESLDDTLSELQSDLECFYNDGRDYTARIVCNDRM